MNTERHVTAATFERRLRASFDALGLSWRTPALVALSGGPDSVALLAGLSAIGAGPLRAIHVDHGLRPAEELARELALVRELARNLGIPLSVSRAERGAIARLAAASGEGIEAAARHFRYAAFRRTARRWGIARVYLAHTRDDQLETLLMRALTGSGSAGLRGIPALNGLYVRPLLEFSKAELFDYLTVRGLAYSVDSTNSSDAYARNRIRAHLVPALYAHFPGWDAGLLRTAVFAAEDDEALASLARGYAFRVHTQADGAPSFATPVSAFLAAPPAVQRRALLEAMAALKADPRKDGSRISSRLAAAALAAASRGGRYRGGGIELRREGTLFVLSRALDFPERYGYFVQIDRLGTKGLRIRAGLLRVEVRWVPASSAAGPREGSFSFPLIIRSRRSGDALAMPRGGKAVDELLAEWRVPVAARALVPVLEDREGLVAVLGANFGGRNRYRYRAEGVEEGRTLMIEVKGAMS